MLIVTVLVGCAKQGMPTGGPKDETPPQTKRFQPENNTLRFSGNSFFIEFDEYVVIKDADNNVIVSPPLKNKAEYKTKGRGIQVKINDTLEENTTYLFQFKDAVADFNEGNLLHSLEYVFSTGSYIDSMALSGQVVDAMTNDAREETMSVWLYNDERYKELTASLADTVNKKVVPSYLTRCDKNGFFRFNNIRPGEYYVIAAVDDDKNLMPGVGESLAFTDSPVSAFTMYDSVAADSLKGMYTMHKPIKMVMFTPKLEKQRITGSEFKSAGKIQITSLLPMINPIVDGGGEETVWKLNHTRDTLQVWTLRERCDSIRLVVRDSSGIQDTLKLRWRAKKGHPSVQTIADASVLGTKLNFKTLPYFDTLAVLTTVPLKAEGCKVDSTVVLMRLRDSSSTIGNMTIDSTGMRAYIVYPFRQGEKYKLVVDKGCLKDIYGHSNDTIRATVTVTSAEDYGNLRLKVVADTSSSKLPVIVHLLNEKGDVAATRLLSDGEGDVVFPHLAPGKYKVRAIIDRNNNGKWDTGDFILRQQPEKTLFLGKTLEIRANWDFEETLKIGD